MSVRAVAVQGLAVVLALGGITACQTRPSEAPASSSVPAEPGGASGAPTMEELAGATYQGIEEADGPVTLVEGVWEGEPFVEGGASRPAVNLVRGFRVSGDLDGDGQDEAVVMLSASAGGSGAMLYLAVVGRETGQPRNRATAIVGDRVQLREARLEGRQIVLDVVQAGPTDAMCCPGDLVSRRWEFSADLLREGEPTTTGRLSIETIAGAEWVLRAWDLDEPAPAAPEVTLLVEGDRLSGSSGCNRYNATVKAGEAPGDLSVGPLMSTRMACPEPEMAVETRFGRQMGAVRKMQFMVGRLLLTYEKNGSFGGMAFERRAPTAP